MKFDLEQVDSNRLPSEEKELNNKSDQLTKDRNISLGPPDPSHFQNKKVVPKSSSTSKISSKIIFYDLKIRFPALLNDFVYIVNAKPAFR